ncbi:uncharacterized protein LOC112549540 [Alligator sinensis]|uniref:Uncharacterized protein LOC112549540 n=1 Tax=Alligator sinensis TaxID=38654 RepID=A0A3Q0G417_ALLSI|nr:uncharacterized protein LOC112549540 [Alligator sinensis]
MLSGRGETRSSRSSSEPCVAIRTGSRRGLSGPGRRLAGETPLESQLPSPKGAQYGAGVPESRALPQTTWVTLGKSLCSSCAGGAGTKPGFILGAGARGRRHGCVQPLAESPTSPPLSSRLLSGDPSPCLYLGSRALGLALAGSASPCQSRRRYALHLAQACTRADTHLPCTCTHTHLAHMHITCACTHTHAHIGTLLAVICTHTLTCAHTHTHTCTHLPTHSGISCMHMLTHTSCTHAHAPSWGRLLGWTCFQPGGCDREGHTMVPGAARGGTAGAWAAWHWPLQMSWVSRASLTTLANCSSLPAALASPGRPRGELGWPLACGGQLHGNKMR